MQWVRETPKEICGSSLSQRADRDLTGQRLEQIARIIPGMKTLAVALLFVPSLASAYLDYNGFENCVEDGWSCTREGNKTVVTFDCTNHYRKSGRIWVWTARLPSETDIFAVRNCDLLELHVDCTLGHRSHRLVEFRLERIKRIDFLKITPRHQLLHDNGGRPAFPPVVTIRDVGDMTVRTGLFNGGSFGNACHESTPALRNLTMVNVGISHIDPDAINVKTIHWWNVSVANDLQRNAIIAQEGLSIGHSRFRDIHYTGLQANGSEVALTQNLISNIYNFGIFVKAGRFTFDKNTVYGIATDGLHIYSSDVSIRGNRFNHLNKGAFQKIGPWYDPDRLVAYNLTYTFSGNHIHTMSQFALSCDWAAYQSVCHDLVLDGNVFQCDCVNLAWLTSARDNGFYKKLLEGANLCSPSLNCTLASIVDDICQKDHNLTSSCLLGTATEESWTDVPEVKLEYISVLEHINSGKLPPDYDSNSGEYESDVVNDSMQRGRSYYVDQSRASEAESGFPVWAIIAIVLVLALIHGAGFFIWYATRKRHFKPMIHKFDNRKGDLEDLVVNPVPIVHMECENITYVE